MGTRTVFGPYSRLILWGCLLFGIFLLLSRLIGGTFFHAGVLAFASPADMNIDNPKWNIVIYDLATHVMIRPVQYERRTPSILDWSPDGSAVAAVIGGNRDGNMVKVTGRGAQPLLDEPASVGWPEWSPDGTQITFMMGTSGRAWDIYVVNDNGENLRRLTNNQDSDVYPAWSPDGSQIAFNSPRDNRTSVYIVNADGTGERRLPAIGNYNADQSPSWSPDGSRIAIITAVRSQEKVRSVVAIMNTDGSDGYVLAPETAAFQGFPSWSPDGHYLAFVASENNRDAIYVVDMWQGGAPRKIADNVYYVYDNRWEMWSPDGREIAFSQAPPPVSGRSVFYPTDGLYLVDVASGNIRKISDIAAAYPVWQPEP